MYRTSDDWRFRLDGFLPVREGVSLTVQKSLPLFSFLPCTGGCIVREDLPGRIWTVSSLYGRVYRLGAKVYIQDGCFLPVREGVSLSLQKGLSPVMFPPYTGGCITACLITPGGTFVSSLHGRGIIYHTNDLFAKNGFSLYWRNFFL